MPETFSIEVPNIDIPIEKIKEVCDYFGCQVEKQRNGYLKITTTDQMNFFWLGINWNHKFGFEDVAATLKKEKPWLYK